jgi:hypothetical protein
MSEGQSPKSPIQYLKEQIANLANYEGMAELTIVDDGKISTKRVKLKKSSFGNRNVDFDDGSSLPLLGTGVAIQKITDDNDKLLYINPEVKETYSPKNSAEIRKKCGFE